MLKRNTKMNLIEGPIFSSIIKYAFPIYLMGLLQNLMVAADSAVLGNMADSTAIASVGATSVIINLMVASIIAIAEGVKLVVGRAIGSKNFDRCRQVISTAMIAAVGVGAVVAAAGLLVAKDILFLVNCPAECMDDAALYLRIYFCSVPIILIYNFGAAIVMVSGDSSKPMKYMLISGIVNVCLNIVLCLVLENKVLAVAIATVAGNALSAALVLKDLTALGDGYSLDIKHLSFSKREFWLILRLGIPFTVASLTFSLSNVQIQAELNRLGASAIAGNVAAGYIELAAASCIVNAFSGALNAFLSQNIGAERHDRVGRSLRASFICSMTAVVISCAVALVFARQLISLFVPDDIVALDYGAIRNKFILAAYPLRVVASTSSTVVAVLGYGYISTVNTLITVLLYRIIYMSFIYPLNPGVVSLYMTYVTSWTLETVFIAIAFIILYSRYKKGKYNKSF